MDLSRFSIDEIIGVICKIMGISKAHLISNTTPNKFGMANSMVVYYAHYFGGYSFNCIANVLSCDAKMLSKMMHKTISLAEQKAETMHWMKAIEHAFWMKLIELNLKD